MAAEKPSPRRHETPFAGQGRVRWGATRVLVAVALLGCAGGGWLVRQSPLQVVRFVAEPGSPSFEVRGRLAGTAHADGSWIHVTVAQTWVSLPAGSARQWRDLRLRAVLEVGSPGSRMDAVSESLPILLWPLLRLQAGETQLDSATYTLTDTLLFALAVPPSARPATMALHFTFEWPTRYGDHASLSFTYSRTDSLVFSSLNRQ